jgi:hypothetical protein
MMTLRFRLPLSLRATAFLALAALAFYAAESSAAGTITVDDPRPLAAALDELENRYGWRVTYEDPPYLHDSEIADISHRIARAGSGARVLVPKGGRFTFAPPSRASAAASPQDIDDVVRSYNRKHRADAFTVIRGKALLHVVPVKTLGREGRVLPVTPLLDTPVTIPAKRRTALELLEAICEAITANAGQKLSLGAIPVKLLDSQVVASGAMETKARTLIEDVVLASGAPLTWRLLHDPELAWYFLNIGVVVQAR